MKILATGRFRYGADTFLPVRIVERNILPGSGDYEDPDEVQEDQVGTFFEIQFSTTLANQFNASGGYYKSLEEAKNHAVVLNLDIIWE